MMFNYELYKGCEIIVDYKAQNNQDIIDYFEEASNFEGYATLNTFDVNEGLFTIQGMELDYISCVYLIVMNQDTNEFEYLDINSFDDLNSVI